MIVGNNVSMVNDSNLEDIVSDILTGRGIASHRADSQGCAL